MEEKSLVEVAKDNLKPSATKSTTKPPINKLWDKNKTYLLVIFLLIFTGLFYQSMLGNGMAGGGDFYNYQLTFLEFLKSSFAKSQSILWNPYIGTGVPMTIFSPIFYPVNFLYFFTPLHFYMLLFYLIHFLIAFIGTYLLARSYEGSKAAAIIAAMIFILSGFFSIRVYMGHTDLVAAAVYIPWQFLMVNKYFKTTDYRYLLLLAPLLSLQIFTGNLQIGYYAALVSGFYFLAQLFFEKKKHKRLFRLKSMLWFTVANLLGLGLAIFSWLPSQASAFFTTRGGTLPFEIVASYAQPFDKILLMIFPTPFIKALTYEGINFFGLTPLILVIIALIKHRQRWVVWFFFSLIILTILVASGENSPLFRLFYYILPGFSSMRAHSRVLIFLILAVAILSAFGFDSLMASLIRLRNSQRFSKVLPKMLIGGGISLVILAFPLRFSGQLIATIFSRYFIFVYMVTFGFLFIGLSLFLTKKINRTIWLVVFSIILGITYYKFNYPYLTPHNFTYPVKSDREIAEFIKSIDSDKGYRVWHDTNFEDDYLPRLFNFSQFGVNEAQLLGRNWLSNSYLQLKEQRPLTHEDYVTTNIALLATKINLKLFGVKYFVSVKPDLEDVDLKPVKMFTYKKDYGLTSFPVYLYEFANPNQLFYFQEKKEDFESRVSAADQKGIKLITYEQNRAVVQIDNNTQTDKYLVFNDLNFPGWKAKVNNQETAIETINLGVKGIKAPSKAKVEFVYQPPFWTQALFISFISLTIFLSLLSVPYFLKKRSKSAVTLSKSNSAA